jgi:tetratricopeptide (TPR) repeat protein
MKDDIDAILVTLVKVDCNFVKKNLEPKFRKNPTDIGLAKKIFYFMLKDNCTDDPLWLETGEAIHKAEPDFGLIKNLGVKYMSREQFDKAQASFEEAQKLATESADKADISIYLGGLEAKKGNKAAARQFFRQALEFDGSKKEAYEKIGDLYYNSFNDCKKEQNMADDRAVYLIAYDYYAKAGEGKKMQAAKEQFPSKEEIFLVNYQSGQSIRVGCWIGESTTVRTRD